MRLRTARRRLRQFEELGAPVVPNVIECDDDDIGAAIERHVERYGRAPSAFIVVPTRANDDELSELEIQWAEQQKRLIADAKAERREEDNAGTEHRTGSNRSRIIVGVGDATTIAAKGVARRSVRPVVGTRH